MFGVLVLIYKGKLVPGFIYDREVERGDKATAIGEQTVTALQSLADKFDGFVAGVHNTKGGK
jgi:hypothetical protein